MMRDSANEQKKERGIPIRWVGRSEIRIDALETNVQAGEALGIIGVKETDILKLFNAIHLAHSEEDARSSKGIDGPRVRLVRRTPDLFSNYSVYDNFMLAEPQAYPFRKKNLHKIIDVAKTMFDLDIDFDAPVKRLSTSKRILADMVRSFLMNPDVYVLDNLFAYMDYKDVYSLIAIILELRGRGRHILYLTTKWEDAIRVSSQLIVLMDGEVLSRMSSEEAKKNPRHLINVLVGREFIEESSFSQSSKELLSLLYTGAEYLSSNYELKSALEGLAGTIKSAMRCDEALIYLLDDQGGPVRAYAKELPVRGKLAEEAILLWLHSGEEVLYATFEDHKFEKLFAGDRPPYRSLICMRIVRQGKPVGLIQSCYKGYYVYDDSHLMVLRSLCKEMLILLETSRLMGNSILLQESNHRIKNNLQIIVNVLMMQRMYAGEHPEETVQKILDSLMSRIRNIASVHEILSRNSTRDNRVSLREIVGMIFGAYDAAHIQVQIEMEDVPIPYNKTTSVSMVLNEMLANCFKYAFRDREGGRIRVSCRREGALVRLVVEDDGVGLPENFDLESATSIGCTIMKSIARIDLNGDIALYSAEKGSRAEVFFPEFYSYE